MTEQDRDSLYYQAKQLFLETVDLDIQDRAHFLNSHCIDSPSLKKTVETLLEINDLHPLPPVADADPEPCPTTWGPFLISSTLARGGTATVYRARRPDRPEDIALKVFNPGFSSPEARARFEQEASVLSRLDHPGIVQLVDHGTLPASHGPADIQVPYVATEFVAGFTLLDWVRERQPTLEKKLEMLQAIAATVGYAHRQGVVHRDLKPNNIIVRSDGTPCVLDFGIARLKDGATEESAQFTRVGQLLGTIRYMSPEQARGDEVGPQTDVHALGLIACELLTGQLPYAVPEETLTRAVASIAGAEPALLSQLETGFPRPLEAVVFQALNRQPEKRYADAGAMADDLHRVLDGSKVKARSPGLGDRLGQKRRRLLALAVLVPLALCAVVVGWQLLAGRSAQDLRQAGVYGLLDGADQRIHLETRTPEGLREAVQNLEYVRSILAGLPVEPEGRILLRYVHWRLGEAHYFLGGMDDSAASYLLAEQNFSLASQIPFYPDGQQYLLADHAVSNRALDVSLHHPSSGLALAHAALADLGSFVEETDLAVTYARVSLAEATRPDSLAFRLNPSPPLVSMYRIIAHGDLGRYLTLLATATDSLALVDEALSLFATVDGAPAWRFNRGAYGMLQEYTGQAYLLRAGMLTGPKAIADRDSAAVHLERALEIRSTGRFPMGHVLTQGTQARLSLWDGRHASDPETARLFWNQGLRRVQDALQTYAGLDPVPRYAARLHLTAAELLEALGDADGATEHLVEADGLAPVRLWPREAAQVRLQRCRLALQAGQIDQARSFWEEGSGLAAGNQNPDLSRAFAELASGQGW